MSEAPQFDRKMSDAEGLMWRLEKDPHLSSTFAAVTILDRPPDFDRLLARMERAVHVVERLGQRVQPVPVNLTAPTWVDDSNFDLRYHVRHIALPKPGTMRQLLDLASLIACDPFDRTRPLWQFVVVDGLRGGKSALIEKLHHTITDGEGSVKLSLQFLDFERDAPEPPPIDFAAVRRSPAATDGIRTTTCSTTCWPAAFGCRSGSFARSGICSAIRPAFPMPVPQQPTRCAGW